MTLREKIKSDTTGALKMGDRITVGVLRMVSSRILEREVELRSKKGKDYQLNDQETVEVINSYAKQRRQSIDSYREAGRDDLVAKEEAELEILQKYLPRQLSEAEIERHIEEAVAEVGAEGPQHIGQVMRAVMPRLKGAADGKKVNELVRQKLAH
jgi:uncharacterized protein YqeY